MEKKLNWEKIFLSEPQWIIYLYLYQTNPTSPHTRPTSWAVRQALKWQQRLERCVCVCETGHTARRQSSEQLQRSWNQPDTLSLNWGDDQLSGSSELRSHWCIWQRERQTKKAKKDRLRWGLVNTAHLLYSCQILQGLQRAWPSSHLFPPQETQSRMSFPRRSWISWGHAQENKVSSKLKNK